MSEKKEAVESNKMVTVGCKLPHGLKLDLELPGKPKVRHILKGTNSSSVIGGFGLTEVPEDFWNEWVKRNKDLEAVKKLLVWSYPSREGARSKALEMAELRHGVEPINPNDKKDKRIPFNVKPDDGDE